MNFVSLPPGAITQHLRIFRLALAFLFIHIACAAQRDIPPLEGRRLHDEAAVLSPNAINALEQQLKAFEDSTSNQIAILVVSSLQGEEPEQYAMRVAKEWKLGTSKNDNGILILVAVDDHKMRIEVGQGLEGALPDVVCGRIIRNEMAPNFRRGDYDTGLSDAVNAILQATRGEYHSDRSGKSGEGNPAIPFLFVFGILAVFTFKALFTAGCAGWGLYGFLSLFYAVLPLAMFESTTAAIVIFLTYIIGFPILKLLFGKSAWGQRMAANMASGRGSRGWSSSGGWFIGGGSGGWGGGGGGGFSGGGGSFGGGGASGSW